MSDKKNINIDNINLDDEDFQYEQKLAEQEQEKRRKLEQEKAEAEEKRRKAAREAEKQREQQLARERRELLQLKSGVISEEETTIKKEEHDEIKLTGLAWWSNFWYHNKVKVIVILAVVLVIGYSVFTAIHRERADLTIMMISNSGLDDHAAAIEEFFEKYTDDLDGNGYVHVEVIMIPMNPYGDMTILNANQQKFIAQIQIGEGMIVITDSNTEKDFAELMRDDLAEDFPGNKYIDELGFSLNSKIMAQEFGHENMPNDVHMSIRTPDESMEFSHEDAVKNYEDSYVVFKRIVEDITQRCEGSNDPGLDTEPIHYDLPEYDLQDEVYE